MDNNLVYGIFLGAGLTLALIVLFWFVTSLIFFRRTTDTLKRGPVGWAECGRCTRLHPAGERCTVCFAPSGKGTLLLWLLVLAPAILSAPRIVCADAPPPRYVFGGASGDGGLEVRPDGTVWVGRSMLFRDAKIYEDVRAFMRRATHKYDAQPGHGKSSTRRASVVTGAGCPAIRLIEDQCEATHQLGTPPLAALGSHGGLVVHASVGRHCKTVLEFVDGQTASTATITVIGSGGKTKLICRDGLPCTFAQLRVLLPSWAKRAASCLGAESDNAGINEGGRGTVGRHWVHVLLELSGIPHSG